MGIRSENVTRAIKQLHHELQNDNPGHKLTAETAVQLLSLIDPLSITGYKIVEGAFSTPETAATLLRRLLQPDGIRSMRASLYFSRLRLINRECKIRITKAKHASALRGDWSTYFRQNVRLLHTWRLLLVLAIFGRRYQKGGTVNVNEAITRLAELIAA